MVNETHDGGFQGRETQREQREAFSPLTIPVAYQESSSIIISFSPEWARQSGNLALQNVHGTQGANRLGLPPSVMLSNKKGIDPMVQRISPGTELHSGVAAHEEMGQRDYRRRALEQMGITVDQNEDATLIHISRIPPNQWVQVNGQKYYGPMGGSLSTEKGIPVRGMPARYEAGRQAEEQVPDGEIEVASVLGEDPVALAGRVNIEERRRSTEARRNELRHLALLQETEQTWYNDFIALVRRDGKVFESAVRKYVHDRNEVLHRDGLHMGVAFGRVKLAPWEGARGRRGLRGVPVMPMPQGEMQEVEVQEVMPIPQPEGVFTLEQLEPQLVQEIQLLPVEFQRPVVLLAERMEVRERRVLIVLLEKLIRVGIGTFLSLPLFTPDGHLKKPGEGDMPADIKQLLESLSPEERDVLERVAAICLDLKGVGALASRPGRTESYPIDEESPALKAKILGMAKRFTEAKIEEDKLIAEGSLRMAGVDIEGSDLKGGKLTMLPTTGSARFVNLIVGLIQMGVGIFRKLGGKKTKIEKEQEELQLPEKPKDPKEMTPKEREDELKKDRGAVAESLEKEKKLTGDIAGLEAKLKDDKLDEKTRPELTKRLGEVKKELSDLQAARAKMEQRIKDLEAAQAAAAEPPKPTPEPQPQQQERPAPAPQQSQQPPQSAPTISPTTPPKPEPPKPQPSKPEQPQTSPSQTPTSAPMEAPVGNLIDFKVEGEKGVVVLLKLTQKQKEVIEKAQGAESAFSFDSTKEGGKWVIWIARKLEGTVGNVVLEHNDLDHAAANATAFVKKVEELLRLPANPTVPPSVPPQAPPSKPQPEKPQGSTLLVPPSKPEKPQEIVRVPDGYAELEPTSEGQKWISDSQRIGGNSLHPEMTRDRLLDTSTFVSPQVESLLRACIGANVQTYQRDGGPSFRITLTSVHENESGGYKFAFRTSNGEVWYLSESRYYADQFEHGLKYKLRSIALWKDGTNKLTQNIMKADELFVMPPFDKEGTGEGSSPQFPRPIGINFQNVVNKIREGEENAESEKNDPADMKNFDFPHDRPVGYIGLVDPGGVSEGGRPPHDNVIGGGVNDVRFFPEMMNGLKDKDGQRRYHIVTPKEAPTNCIVVKSDPEQILRSQIQGMVDKGITDIYLHFAGHGNTEGIYFRQPPFEGNPRYKKLTPDQMHKIFADFPQCRFTVNTIACHGGGFAGKMKEYIDPTSLKDGRITMVLQSKLYDMNQEGRLQGTSAIRNSPETRSTYYNLFFVHFIKDHPAGEAHRLADRAAKQLVSCDAEGWRSRRSRPSAVSKGISG